LAAAADCDAVAYQALLAEVQTDSDAIRALLGAATAPPPSLEESQETAAATLDRADELQAEWQVERGDVWALGPHRVVCGDSTDRVVVATCLGETTVTMAMTDPPYNVAYGRVKAKGRAIANDQMDAPAWQQFVAGFGAVLKDRVTGDCYVWGAAGPSGLQMSLQLIALGLHWSATVVWVKSQLVLTRANYQRRYEPCLYGWFGAKSSFQGDRCQMEVSEVPRPHASPEHPTMKPVDLMSLGIRNSSAPGDTVFDGFLGSGSTLLACEQHGRVCRGVELEPKYVAVTLERWTTQTGEPPLRV
jgi:site-specific DNA-methyltransferase (adenine-specific)